MSFHASDGLRESSEKRFRLLQEIQRKPDLPSAMHEAGQAFAYEYYDIRVKGCALEKSIRMVNGQSVISGGTTEPANGREITKYNLWQEVVCLMAGAAAQHAIDEQGAMNRAAADMQRAAECIEHVGLNQQQADELIVAAAKTAAEMMMENIATVRKIADVLEKKKRIEGDEIQEIIRRQKRAAIHL